MHKRTARSFPLIALLAATAQAQSGTVTSTIPVCPTATSITVTLPTTLTFCPGPHCNGGGMRPMVTPPPHNGVGMAPVHVGEYTSVGPDGKTTVLGIYETVFDSLCETGLVPATWTITQSCPCDHAGMPQPTIMPDHFETKVIPCNVCGPHQSAVTLTQPVPAGPYATQTPSVGQTAPMPMGPGPAGPAATASAGAQAQASAMAGAMGSSSAMEGSASGAAGAPAAPGAMGASPAAGGMVLAAGGSSSGANAGAGAGAEADAMAGPNGTSANVGVNANAVANINVAAQAAPNGMKVAPVNSTMPANNMTKPAAPGPQGPVNSYVSSAVKASLASFTTLAGVLAAFLLQF